MRARLETGLATLCLGLGRWLESPHPYPHPCFISGGLSCLGRIPCMLEPGEFQGPQLMGTWSARHFSEFMESSINQAAGMMLGLGGGHSLICHGLWVEMGPRKKDLSLDSPLACHCVGCLGHSLQHFELTGHCGHRGPVPGHFQGTCISGWLTSAPYSEKWVYLGRLW